MSTKISYEHISNADDIIQVCPIPSNICIVARFGATGDDPPFDLPVLGIAVTKDGGCSLLPFSPDGFLDPIDSNEKNFIEYKLSWEKNIIPDNEG